MISDDEAHHRNEGLVLWSHEHQRSPILKCYFLWVQDMSCDHRTCPLMTGYAHSSQEESRRLVMTEHVLWSEDIFCGLRTCLASQDMLCELETSLATTGDVIWWLQDLSGLVWSSLDVYYDNYKDNHKTWQWLTILEWMAGINNHLHFVRCVVSESWNICRYMNTTARPLHAVGMVCSTLCVERGQLPLFQAVH